MPYSITREDAERDLKALRGALSGFLSGASSNITAALQELADSIEEQVKPVVEEPKEFGSIVRAGYDERSIRVLWVRTPGGWYAEESAGYHAYFPGLHEPEVLRVGIGDDEWHRLDVANAQTDAYTKGAEDMRAKVIENLQGLLTDAILSQHRAAYIKAIRAAKETQL